MASSASTDKRVAFPLAFGTVAVLGAVGMAVFGLSGDQVASGWSFAAAMLAGTLVVAGSHVYG
jgi:hypothetical protein